MKRSRFALTVPTVVPRPKTRYTYGWLAWAAISAGGFAILEGIALAKGEHGNTLSCHWRRVMGIYPEKPWTPAGKTVVISGLAWVAYHIAFEPGDDPRLRNKA